MDARKCKRIVIVNIGLVVFLVLTGCKAEATEQEPEREIVYEKEVRCPIANFIESTVEPIEDPEEKTAYFRAYTHQFDLTCSEQYVEGRVLALLDGYTKSDYTSFMWGYYELVTTEGGVWKGMCEGVPTVDTQCPDMVGEGIYEGLHLLLEYDVATSTVNFTVFRLPEVEE
jgi:hypothetical protein